MDCRYEMIETQEITEQGHAYTGYGIEAWGGSGTERRLLHRVPDLFVCPRRCADFVQMCNEQQVASFHLLEVIDNLLAEEWGETAASAHRHSSVANG